jgi:hypothetical protein
MILVLNRHAACGKMYNHSLRIPVDSDLERRCGNTVEVHPFLCFEVIIYYDCNLTLLLMYEIRGFTTVKIWIAVFRVQVV